MTDRYFLRGSIVELDGLLYAPILYSVQTLFNLGYLL